MRSPRCPVPGARSLVAIVLRMHPESVRSPRRSMANLEFHRIGHEVDEVAARIARALAERGHRAINPPMAFPMDMTGFVKKVVKPLTEREETIYVVAGSCLSNQAGPGVLVVPAPQTAT